MLNTSNNESPLVTILLASYNGEDFIENQIDSIINQTFKNWELLIRDDGSSDNTVGIIEKYCLVDDRIKLLKDNVGNLRSAQNFSQLIGSRLSSPYIMFADQDDLWYENKVELSISSMIDCEAKLGTQAPILIYSNFTYVNADLVELNYRPNIFNAVRRQEDYLPLLFAQNWIYGCTMMINNSLTKLVYPVPVEAENHDYWVAVVAAYKGFIYHIETPTLKYRQHLNNVSGSYKDSSISKRIVRLFDGNKAVQSVFSRRLLMLEHLFSISTDKKRQNLLKGFVKYFGNGGPRAVLKCMRDGVKKRGRIQTLMFYFNVLCR